MHKYKLVFFGTSEFAVPSLRSLEESDLFEIITVITAPDKPVGRDQVLTPSPIAKYAEEHHLKTMKPAKLNDILGKFGDLKADVGVVVSYGKIIPEAFINALPHGIVNVHASLLPRHRGASPIQNAILHEDDKTGITIMLIDKGMDTGPILITKDLPLTGHETTESLAPKLAEEGSKLLLKALPKYLVGTLTPKAQSDKDATHAAIIHKEDGHIDTSKSAKAIDAQIRAYTPWPGSFVKYDGKMLKIHESSPTIMTLNGTIEPGILEHVDGKLYLGTGDGVLDIGVLQVEGKQKQGARDFINGNKSKFPIKTI